MTSSRFCLLLDPQSYHYNSHQLCGGKLPSTEHTWLMEAPRSFSTFSLRKSSYWDVGGKLMNLNQLKYKYCGFHVLLIISHQAGAMLSELNSQFNLPQRGLAEISELLSFFNGSRQRVYSSRNTKQMHKQKG